MPALQTHQKPTTTIISEPTKVSKPVKPIAKEVVIIKFNEIWQYKKGNTVPKPNWFNLNFDDSKWLTGKAGFGYADGDDMTILDDMQNNYTTVYARKHFSYSDDYPINTMLLNIFYDDGYIAYLNGQEIARVNMPNGEVSHLTTAKTSHEARGIVSVNLSQFKHLIKAKQNVLAIEIHNSSIRSSDLSLNPSLVFNGDTSRIKSIKPVASKKSQKKTNKKHRRKKLKINTFCKTTVSCGSIGNYQLEVAFEKLDYIADDLSGITYVKDSDTFYLINNGYGYILEVDTSFKLLRKIKTTGFGDSEDLVYLGSKNEFAIVNEHSKLYIGTITADATMLDAKDFQEITFDTYKGNQGPEGVAFDIATQTFYIVKEMRPRKLYSFVRPAHHNNVTITPTIPFDIQKIPHPRQAQDLSAVTFNPATGRLLLLSDIDYRVVDIDLDGKVYGILQLPIKRQPEGIALDKNHNIHIVGEPNNHTLYSNPN